MVVASSNAEQHFGRVNVVAEVVVVDFIGVALVAVGLEEKVENVVTGAESALSKDSQELMLGDVLVSSDVEIGEDLLNVDSLDLNG